jgi:phosphatidylserine/phosphatidylglycerophosphate/cardiolipin synthase-like enzyme
MEAAGILVVDDNRSGLMHDKFWIFDNQIVWTGSTNITVNGTTLNNNNSVVINSPDLAFIYELEFEEMFSGGEFGKTSTSTVPLQHLTLNDTPIAVFFGAEDQVAAQLTRLIQSANFSIEFMAFSFTHDEMGSAMIERFEEGVDVVGIFETRGSETAFSEMPQMFCLGIPVRQDGNPRTFHHKVIIIDNRIVITGSFNFSENADKTNDENVIIIASEDIAFLFMQEFEARWAEATAPTEGEDVICE